jgi:hypothetical protein
MTTYRFTHAPPTEEEIRAMMNPTGVTVVVGELQSPQTFDVELESANQDDHDQLLIGMRPRGWKGAVVP